MSTRAPGCSQGSSGEGNEMTAIEQGKSKDKGTGARRRQGQGQGQGQEQEQEQNDEHTYRKKTRENERKQPWAAQRCRRSETARSGSLFSAGCTRGQALHWVSIPDASPGKRQGTHNTSQVVESLREHQARETIAGGMFMHKERERERERELW